VHGVPEFPVYYMRGGTSTGIVLWHEHLPEDQALKEELIRAIMGVPASGETRATSRRPASARRTHEQQSLHRVPPRLG